MSETQQIKESEEGSNESDMPESEEDEAEEAEESLTEGGGGKPKPRCSMKSKHGVYKDPAK